MTRSIAALTTCRPAPLIGLAAILIAVGIDQITKLIALSLLSRGEAQRVLPFFDLRLSFNEGVSFGLFAQTFADRPLALVGIIFAIDCSRDKLPLVSIVAARRMRI